jgi:DNA-binding response OmpR family regulator
MAGETILVVDDSPPMRELMERAILEPMGYRVITAPDGNAGLRAAVGASPDLILLDMSMPGMSGLEMLEALRRTNCESPVILMTSHGSENIAVEAFRLGVRDYLIRPIRLEDARRAVDRALRESRLAGEREELSRSLLTAEAVRVTVATLSHYLNNHLMAVSGSLTLLGEALEQDEPETDAREILYQGKQSLQRIQVVLNVLRRATEVKTTPYAGAAPMLDIATTLETELEKISAAPPDPRRDDPEGC